MRYYKLKKLWIRILIPAYVLCVLLFCMPSCKVYAETTNIAKGYYYQQLTELEKQMYEKMSRADVNNSKIIISNISGYNEEELLTSSQRAYTALCSDEPMIHMYWGRYVDAKYSDDEKKLEIQLEKNEGTSEYKVNKAQQKVDQIVEMIGTEGDTYTRLRNLVTYLGMTMDYDPYYVFSAGNNSVMNDCALGCLYYDVAVCAGFSDTLKILCDRLDIPCVIVGNHKHAWNYVQMEDGLWYSVDLVSLEKVDMIVETGCSVDDFMNSYLLLGKNSIAYATESNYQGSDLYLTKPGDFTFPILNDEQYKYNGEYIEKYETLPDIQDKEGEFIYSINEDGLTCAVIDYEGLQEDDLIIPESIDDYKVTSISKGAFFGCRGFSGDLIIPDTVTSIGNGAFAYCTGLKGKLKLPSQLKCIEQSAFLGCENLSGEIEFPVGLETIGEYAFYSCKSLTGDIILPDTLKSVESAFSHCDSLNGTFYIPDCVTSWDSMMTTGSGFSAFSVSDSNESFMVYDDVLYSKDGKTLIACPKGKEGNLNILQSTIEIEENACNGCSKLTGALVLPDGLISIDKWAFSGCNGITGDLIIPDSVETIQYCAFSRDGDSQPLGRLQLSSNLKNLEDWAFANCKFSEDIVIPDSLENIEGDLVFDQSVPSIVCSCNNDIFIKWINGITISDIKNKLQLKHKKLEEISSNKPTCTEKGYSIYKCPECGNEFKDDFVDELGHDMSLEWTIDVQATCMSDGEKSHHCKRENCEYRDDVIITGRTDHAWNDGEVTKEPTTTEKGEKTFKCMVEGCDEIKTEEIPCYDPIPTSSTIPSQTPSIMPTTMPTTMPSLVPSVLPTSAPSVVPSVLPTSVPSVVPSVLPTSAPSVVPSVLPTSAPSVVPSVLPTSAPSVVPSVLPTSAPSVVPSVLPTSAPSVMPSGLPTVSATPVATAKPSIVPTQVARPKKGEEIKDDKSEANFEVSDTKKKEVEYTAPTNTKATTVTIPTTIKVDGVTYKVTKIDDNALKNNKKVTKVTVGNGIQTIGKNAFNGAIKLKTVSVGKNVVEIGAGAFKGCSSLTSVSLPSKTTKFGTNAFNGCKKLKTIKISSTKLTDKTVSKDAFRGISKSTTIKVPKKKLNAYKKLFKAKGLSSKVKIVGY